MPAESILKAALRATLRTALGRRNYYRLGRFLWLDARLDVPNDSRTNGEFRLLERAIALAASRGNLVIFDVGGNIGRYSEQVLRFSALAGVQDAVRLFCFEPNPVCVETIRERLQHQVNFHRATIVPLAVTDECGRSSFFITGETSGTSSLRLDGFAQPSTRVEVDAGTLDDFCHRNNIARVNFVKVDTEGNDMRVIRGAVRLLQAGAIDYLQFEYNCRWVSFRDYLKDVFDFVQPMGYRIGKVVPDGIETFDMWRPDLEVFQEGNYLIGRDLAALGLPLRVSVIR